MDAMGRLAEIAALSTMLIVVGNAADAIYTVRTTAMEPTFLIGDHVLAPGGEQISDLRRGDVIALRYPPYPEAVVIKRLIGLPGDHVRIMGGVLVVNSRRASESYVQHSAGASVSIRICSASSIRPSPMATRPKSLTRVRAPSRKARNPIMKRIGATAAILNERTWTIRVVPTLAPSMIAKAGTRATIPSEANEAVISPVAVLLCKIAVRPRPATNAENRLPNAFDKNALDPGQKHAGCRC